jgi:hypothetical protein
MNEQDNSITILRDNQKKSLFFLPTEIPSISKLDERYCLGQGATKGNLKGIMVTAAPLKAGLRHDGSTRAPPNNTVPNTVTILALQPSQPYDDSLKDNRGIVVRLPASGRN